MIDKIENWEHIFLDTSVIIDLFVNSDSLINNKPVQERVINTQKLFDYFNKVDKTFTFYVSAITIAEMTRGNKEKLIDALFVFFGNSNLTFVDYTKEIAIQISKNIKEYIPEYNYNQLISQLKKEIKNDTDVINARNWITDDLKIVSSAKSLNKIDVVLTADKKTFVPIAERLKLPILQTNNLPKDLFNDISPITSI